MSDLVFPNNLPGMDVEVERGTAHRVSVFTTVSGREQRVSWGGTPTTRFHLSMVLRSNVSASAPWSSYSELAVVQSFVSSHSGSLDSFLFTDPDDGAQYRVRFGEGEVAMRRVVQGIWTTEFDLVTVGE